MLNGQKVIALCVNIEFMNKNGEILIIEDDEDDREYIESVFTELQYENPRVFVNDANAALDYIRQHDKHPFMIISDINMPGMNGFDLRNIIFSDLQLNEKCIPYIFLSTSDDADLVKKAFKLSVQGYFKKPNEYSELKSVIKQIMEYWIKSCTP